MKIIVERELLEKKLQSLTGVLTSKSFIPILDEALVQVFSDHIVVTASDEQVSASSMIKCEVEGEPFDFVCDIMTISGTISLLKSDTVTLDVENMKNVVLSTPRTRKKYEVPIQYEASSFPSMDNDEWSEAISVNGRLFSKMIKKASLFVNPNDIRPALCGINVVCKNKMFIVQSTNAQVFCRTSIDSNGSEIELKDMMPIILPKSVVKVVSNYDNSNSLEISVDKQGRNVKMYDGSTIVYIRLIDATFPNVDAFYELYNKQVFTKISKDEFIMSIKRISLFTNKMSKTIVLDMEGDNIVIKGENIDFNKKADELIEVETKDKLMNFKTAFNYSFLSASLQALAGENVYFTQVESKSPGYFTDDASEGFGTLWMIAPINV